MPQIMLPHGEYSLHHGPMDMSHNRIAARFGVRGLDGVEDARGPSRVLPLVRGHEGWFYLTDGQRAQLRGIRGLGGLGDAAADSANYLAMAAQVPAGSFLQQSILNCAANPTPNCANAAATSWFNGPTPTAESVAAANAAAAAGQPIPELQVFTGPPPGTYIPSPVTVQSSGGAPPLTGESSSFQTAQEAASAATGKPNQSVPPQTPLTPLPTGTGPAGGNVLIDTGDTVPPPPSGGSGLLLLALGVGLLLMMK